MASSTPISATYRIQFNKDFTFRDATRLLDYFAALGITHIYASPILRSRRGSTHGYDVTDPTRLNPELGSEADFAELQAELRNRGMGLVLDIVPNHMSASSENSWWMDVLENGPESPYASYFDIDWHPPSRSLESKILLPVLGRPFGEALEANEFKLTFQDGRLFVQYFESLFPLAPRTYSRILRRGTDELRKTLGEGSSGFQEYSGISAAFTSFSTPAPTSPAEIARRRPLLESLRERLRQLVSANTQIDSWLRERLHEFEGHEGDASSFSPMELLLSEQFYVLSYWQNVNEEINYRRFFAISDLVGIRVEDPLVFDSTHALTMRLVAQGPVDALRVDHIDGLRDPHGYLNRLREQLSRTVPADASPRNTAILVEKILEKTEQVPVDWPTEGTTGYDFLNALNSVFVNPQGGKCLQKTYTRFISRDASYSDLLYQKKKLAMTTLFGVELRSLGHQLTLLADGDRYARDLARADLTQALIETTAHLPVYRTYIRNLEVSRVDARIIEQSLLDAQQRKFYLRPEYFAFVSDVLLLRNRPHLLPAQREARLNFVMRWQQFTGPIMAKAFEDTFLYVYNPLTSLNEVGGDPRPSQAAPNLFTRFITARRKHWPHALNATTTHDTKRSEDVRARINVLSELPDEWQLRLDRWSKLNAKHKTKVNGQLTPDRNEEIFLYQTLLGAYPPQPVPDENGPFLDRIQSYAIKATREAKVHTRWTLPNVDHESALQKFVAALLAPGKHNAFLSDFRPFQQRIAFAGMLNGLSQALLKIFSPGIPDFYQGSELWDLRLVDPDNRRPVDFSKSAALLNELQAHSSPDSAFISELLRNWPDGRVKLFAIWKALTFRKENQQLFANGDFHQLPATGPRREHIIAILRHHKNDWALLLAPRWLARYHETGHAEWTRGAPHNFWQDTAVSLPPDLPAHWQDVFTQSAMEPAGNRRALSIHAVLQNFPAALLHATQPGDPRAPTKRPASATRPRKRSRS